MTQKYIPACLRDLPKKRQKPRKQAIKEAQVEVLNKAIASISSLQRTDKAFLPLQLVTTEPASSTGRRCLVMVILPSQPHRRR